MQITVKLPEDIAEALGEKWSDLSRVALESLAVEAYRTGALSSAQIGKLLDFNGRFEVGRFLELHEVYEYSVEDFERDVLPNGSSGISFVSQKA